MGRSHASATRMVAAYETSYGSAPATGWQQMPFGAPVTLGAEQGLIDDDQLGFGRDPLEPGRDVIRVAGDVTAPLDSRAIGWWLTLLLGPAAVAGVAPPYTHSWASGAPALPSATIEIGHTRVPRYFRVVGVRADTLSISMQRSGFAQATLGLIGRGETDHAATVEEDPGVWPMQRFNQFQGSIRRDGSALANITGGEVRYSNGLDVVETLRDDALIEDADPGRAEGSGRITARFADMVLLDAATAGTPIDLTYRYRISAERQLELEFPRVYLPRPKVAINGPGGIEATFEWRAAQQPETDPPVPMLRARLITDVAEYLPEPD